MDGDEGMNARKLLAALLLAVAPGCSTLLGTIPSAQSYLGTRAEVAAIRDLNADVLWFAVPDLPFTIVGDTLVLPYTLTTPDRHPGPYGAWGP